MSRPGGRSEVDVFERAADAVFNADYVLIVAGPNFCEEQPAVQPPELSDPLLIESPERFFGVWGKLYNRYHDKAPHDGYHILRRWREQLFDASLEDKKRTVKKKDENAKRLSRTFVVTSTIDGLFSRIGGFQEDEILQMCGSVLEWQCSTPCNPATFRVQKGFRFHIAPDSGFAPPIVLAPDTRPVYVPPAIDIDDPRDQPKDYRIIHAQPGTVACDLAQHRWLLRCSVVRHFPQLTTYHGRYAAHDHFAPLPPSSRYDAPTFTFGGPTDDYLQRTAATGGHRGKLQAPSAACGTSKPTVHGLVYPPAQSPVARMDPETPWLHPQRVSHTACHVEAARLRRYLSSEGTFDLVDPAAYRRQRQDAYQRVVKFFDELRPKESTVRQKGVFYCVSIHIRDYGMVEKWRSDPSASADAGAAGVGAAVNALSDEELLPSEEIAAEAATALPTVSGARPGTGTAAATAPSPSTGAAGGGGAGADVDAAEVSTTPPIVPHEEVREGVRGGWYQGRRRRFFFSHVPPRETIADPDGKMYDVVDIPFPAWPSSGTPDHLPPDAHVSVVVDCITRPPQPTSEEAAAIASKLADGVPPSTQVNPPAPSPFKIHTFQMVGRVPPHAPSAALLAARSSTRGGDTSDGLSRHETSASSARGADESADDAEWVLSSCRGNELRIGTSHTAPRSINYITLEVPLSEFEETPFTQGVQIVSTAGDGGRVVSTRDAVASGAAAAATKSTVSGGVMSSAGGFRPADQKSSTRPSANWIVCPECRRYGRPRVVMGSSDLHVVPVSKRGYMAWEKSVLAETKQDGMSFVIIEAACDRRPSQTKRHSERVWKMIKSLPKSSFIRITPANMETKKTGGNEEENIIYLRDNHVSALSLLDRVISERQRRR